ncbi:FHA domain-containing protein FhaB/FipA [Haematomicrobium sanguinis]|uniref:FHA domain-containing protein FhaB/FipA n=1 Tax=Haematomicrobium sanguinis TaxID=479106 RepID=UPI00047D001F|nr:FHA domain-containing protein [Haematomicrobium sanguinis]
MNDSFDLTINLIRFGFLILLWVLVLSIVAALRSDLAIGRRLRTATAGSRGAQSAEPESPAPVAPTRPTTLQVVEGPHAGTVLELASSPILIGRAQEATLVLDDDYASGRHARLFPQGSRWFVEDLGSTNGTYLDGNQLTRALPVEVGTPIRIGKTVIELRP